MEGADDAQSGWKSLQSGMLDLCVPSEVPRIPLPSPEVFLRDYVCANRPCIITDYASNWNAIRKWNLEYLATLLGSTTLTVNATPDGLGDAVHAGKFVMPEERETDFATFLSESSAGTCGHLYLSFQNDNLRKQAPQLMDDIDLDCHDEWTERVFGCVPDAVNFWVGDASNVSSCHNDFYENLYTVIRGTKVFTLLPPTSMIHLYKKPHPVYRYSMDRKSGEWSMDRVMDEDIDGNRTPRIQPWIPVDPSNPDLETYPRFEGATVLECKIQAGETLYLPAMWYHKVAQEGMTVAVNQWLDMRYDHPYYHMLMFAQSIMRQQLKEDVYF
eukprot:ANDGO_03898.mRNA.1 JmjC domain-containing protein E